jgi:hypothetical protein
MRESDPLVFHYCTKTQARNKKARLLLRTSQGFASISTGEASRLVGIASHDQTNQLAKQSPMLDCARQRAGLPVEGRSWSKVRQASTWLSYSSARRLCGGFQVSCRGTSRPATQKSSHGRNARGSPSVRPTIFPATTTCILSLVHVKTTDADASIHH